MDMDISHHDLVEDSWAVAFDVVRASAKVPANLPHIMRTCWHGTVQPTQFLHFMAGPGLPLECLLRAAAIPHQPGEAPAAQLLAAVDMLGVKASAVILAINSLCERTLDSGPANRIWSPLFKEMMSEIEIGYHLGSSIERVGHEQGMLVGFSRLAGLAVLLIRFPDAFARWFADTGGRGAPHLAVKSFGCEPYQISSALMQHLGLGAEVALATASTLGDIDSEIIEVKPSLKNWTATHKWIHALKNGDDAPACEQSRAAFPELCPADGAAVIPEHLLFLKQQVKELQGKPSEWTWHLPLPSYEETAKAIVYRVNSNACGTTWTKGLVQPATRLAATTR
jgi:hypothetical protein